MRLQRQQFVTDILYKLDKLEFYTTQLQVRIGS